jgi:1,2-diacylglycerol 3-beta-glucosyltransferase
MSAGTLEKLPTDEHPPAAVAATGGSDTRVDGAPWTFVYFVAGFAVLCAALGADRAVLVLTVAVNAGFLVFFVRHVAFAAAAIRWAPRDLYDTPNIDLPYQPLVSVLVACRNEELVVEGLVGGLLALHYPHELLQIIVVDDASDDATGAILDRLAAQHRELHVVHRQPGAGGGKSGALNRALEDATGEIIVVFDADHIPRRNVIGQLVRHFAHPSVSAVQGRCIVRNSIQSKLARSISIDYFSGYLVNEYGRQALFELPAYGGANCAVRASTLREIGGWNTDSVTEDTDLTMRVVLAGYRVRYDITAVDTEEGTTTISRFCQQRYRWARGHQQCWREYRSGILTTPHLSWPEKIESVLFLLVYHIPVLCAISVLLLGMRLIGLGYPISAVELLPLAALLFAGPFCELAVGLMVGRAPRRAAWSVAWMTPLFFLFMLVCTKAWVDGVLGRSYRWTKTKRSSWRPSAQRPVDAAEQGATGVPAPRGAAS